MQHVVPRPAEGFSEAPEPSRDPTWSAYGRAPLRIDLAGGWTDCPDYARRKGGVVVNLAISRYAHAVFKPAPDHGIHLKSSDYDVALDYASPGELRLDGRLDLHKGILRKLGIVEGSLATWCEAPPGSGLGSSGAMGVAMIGAVTRSRGRRCDPQSVCEAAHAVERDLLKIESGLQDQYAAAQGGINSLEVAPSGAIHSESIRLNPEFRLDLERRLLLVYSGQSHFSGRILGSVMAAYRAAHPQIVRALDEIRRAGQEMSVALNSEDLGLVGEVMDFNWENQKKLHKKGLTEEITTPPIDILLEAARAAGVLGAKACGAGGGGCLALLCKPGREALVREAVERAGGRPIDWTLDRMGLSTWNLTEGGAHEP